MIETHIYKHLKIYIFKKNIYLKIYIFIYLFTNTNNFIIHPQMHQNSIKGAAWPPPWPLLSPYTSAAKSNRLVHDDMICGDECTLWR
jgi:hypothetical protein